MTRRLGTRRKWERSLHARVHDGIVVRLGTRRLKGKRKRIVQPSAAEREKKRRFPPPLLLLTAIRGVFGWDEIWIDR